MQAWGMTGNTEAPVESQEELLQHAVGFLNAARLCQPEFGDQPVLKRSRHALHPTLRACLISILSNDYRTIVGTRESNQTILHINMSE